MAGVEGFEPPNASTKNWCLTTWRHPIVMCHARAVIEMCRISSRYGLLWLYSKTSIIIAYIGVSLLVAFAGRRVSLPALSWDRLL